MFRRTAVLFALASAGTVLPAVAGNDLTPCRAIAGRLQASRGAFLSDPDLEILQASTRGPSAPVTLAQTTGVSGRLNANDGTTALRGTADLGDYSAYFARTYHPDPALAAAVADNIRLEAAEVDEFPGGKLRVQWSMGGSAHCATFLFFVQDAGGKNRLAPDPPATMEGGMSDDVGVHRVACYVSQGYLARVSGRDAFVVADRNPVSFDGDMRVSAFDGQRWSNGCIVTAAFDTVYDVARIGVAPDSTITAEVLNAAAPGIADALDRASGDKRPFLFGPPIPPSRRAAVDRVLAALKDGQLDFRDGDAGWKPPFDPDMALDGARVYPVVLGGEVYILRAMHMMFGWRDMPDYAAGLYRLTDGGVRPVAYLQIAARRGPLRSVGAAKPLPRP